MNAAFKVYLPSNACHDHFPNNSPTDYRIQLGKPLELMGKWEVGLDGIFYSALNGGRNEDRLFILCDCIQDMSVGGKRLKIFQDFLHRHQAQTERHFYPINYIPVSKNYIDIIHIQMLDSNFEPVVIRDSHTIVVLHFRPQQ